MNTLTAGIVNTHNNMMLPQPLLESMALNLLRLRLLREPQVLEEGPWDHPGAVRAREP